MAATLQDRGGGEFAIEGDLDFQSVAALWQQARRSFRQQPALRIDLAGVNHSDSSGVALLVDWLRQARERGQDLQFVNIPAQMQAIVRVAGLDGLLPA